MHDGEHVVFVFFTGDLLFTMSKPYFLYDASFLKFFSTGDRYMTVTRPDRYTSNPLKH